MTTEEKNALNARISNWSIEQLNSSLEQYGEMLNDEALTAIKEKIASKKCD